MTSSSSIRVWSRVAWIVPVCFVALVTSTSAGGLDFVEKQHDGVGRQPDAVAVSPDDKYLYVATHGDSTVAVFSRDATTGALTFVEQQEDGAGGVMNMGEPTGVVVSPDPDSGCLYVTSSTDNAVVVFSRNLATGTLTFVGSQQNGVGSVLGL
jgi:DNA-binding beta-propeller fold protein YncE